MDYATLKVDMDALATAQNPSMEEVSQITGLTTRERLLVQRSWQELLKLGRSTVGIEIFDRYFTMFPQYIQAFKKFRDIPIEKLKSHPRLKAHGTTVLNALDSIVENLEDVETVTLLLEKTGQDHDRRGLNHQAFEHLHTSTIALLGDTFKDSWTDEVYHAWDKALRAVLSNIVSAMQAAEKNRTVHE